MSKSKKDIILTSLTNLEKTEEEEEEKASPPDETPPDEIPQDDCIQASKPKKPRTPAQIAVFDKARKNRDANIIKLKEEAQRIAEQDKKIKEEKLIKKAIAVRKKQLKLEQILNEISDDEEGATPPLSKGIQAIKPVVEKPIYILPPKPLFNFY